MSDTTTDTDSTDLLSTFADEMETNPLGTQEDVRTAELGGETYVVEWYSDGIAGPITQVWAYVGEESDHFRPWKKIGQYNGQDAEDVYNHPMWIDDVREYVDDD